MRRRIRAGNQWATLGLPSMDLVSSLLLEGVNVGVSIAPVFFYLFLTECTPVDFRLASYQSQPDQHMAGSALGPVGCLCVTFAGHVFCGSPCTTHTRCPEVEM